MLQSKQTKKQNKTKQIKANKQTKKLPVTMGIFNLKSIQVKEASKTVARSIHLIVPC